MRDFRINVVSDERVPAGVIAFVSPAEIVQHVFPDSSVHEEVKSQASIVVMLPDGRTVGPMPILPIEATSSEERKSI